MDQLALPSVWQIQIPQEHIARVEASPAIVAVPRLTVALLVRVGIAVTCVLVFGNDDDVLLTREDEPFILSVTNAVVALARIEVAWIEIARHRSSLQRPQSAHAKETRCSDYANRT